MENDRIIIAQHEQTETVTIPRVEYDVLREHDVRLSILRNEIRRSIDNDDKYTHIPSEDFILSVLDLANYLDAAKRKSEESGE